MSQFYTFDFEYDGIPSQRWDLKIITFEDGGLFNGVGSSDVNILEQRVLRKSKPYFLGRTQEPKLEFPLTFGTAAPISGMDRNMISAWLFGRSAYKKLYILQDDLNGAYFNCFLTKPEPLYIGGMNYAFQCQVVCDSPWAYAPTREINGILAGMAPYPTLEIYNNSSEDDYLYPGLSVIVGGDVKSYVDFEIDNLTDNGRALIVTSLSGGQLLIVNSELQIITVANPSEPVLSRFNKNWLRLLPGHNELYFVGSLYTTYKITLSERLKIGG